MNLTLNVETNGTPITVSWNIRITDFLTIVQVVCFICYV